ncbi:SagB/ThcOx family dehydrogenase [Longirhabdus pacifica]|uniref:SagB/ThcOx family dehydrogenase n=1 Tax=Longirhabdus pacifica TaxID=2305227 RepID=UPI001008A9BF|nr:SagB/ThcOx family dehydrogenase [Longirhabdus pacifica]
MFSWDFSQQVPEKPHYRTYHYVSNQAPQTQMIAAPREKYEVADIIQPDREIYMHLPSTEEEQQHQVQLTLSDALYKRRSSWQFKGKDLSKFTLAQLLTTSFGLSHQEKGLRTYPSGGMFYSVDIYMIPTKRTINSGLMEAKVYHYNVEQKRIDVVRSLDMEHMHHISSFTDIGHFSIDDAQVVLFLVANDTNVSKKYMEYTYRILLLEAGHMAQNFLLVSTALGLSCVPLGGFHEVIVKKVLGLEQPQYMVLYTLLGG